MATKEAFVVLGKKISYFPFFSSDIFLYFLLYIVVVTIRRVHSTETVRKGYKLQSNILKDTFIYKEIRKYKKKKKKQRSRYTR